MKNTNINQDAFSALCYNLSQTRTTAAEASQALRKIAQIFNKENQTWSYATEALGQLADKCAEIGYASFTNPLDDAEDIKRNAITMLQNSKGVDLLRSETLDATETSNQNEPFDFLEQNAYDEADSGWLTPLDSI